MRAKVLVGAARRQCAMLFVVVAVSLWLVSPCAAAARVRGWWVECEGANHTPDSKAKIVAMLDAAEKAGINTVFLQVYRQNRAWFDSEIADPAPFKAANAADGIDPLGFAIEEAHRRGIAVHAWLNILTLTRNRNAPVLKRLGRDIVITDSEGRSLLDYPNHALPKPEGEFYAISDEQLMLDPAHPELVRYQLSVVEEILRKYPDVDGIHLDYIRYPYTVPYAPGSLFAKGVQFGLGEGSVERFKARTGLDPRTMPRSRANCQKWDDFRREKVTAIVRGAYELCHRDGRAKKLSAAVLAWADRAYLSAFQDWRGWLEEGIVDFVVPMNYTTDRRFARYLSRAAVGTAVKGEVYIGLQAYIAPVEAEAVTAQMADAVAVGAKGFVLFSYDAILERCPGLLERLRE